MNRNAAKIVKLACRAVTLSILLFLFSASGALGYRPIEQGERPDVAGPEGGTPGGGDVVAPQSAASPQIYPLSVGVECRDYSGTSSYLPSSLGNCNGVYYTLRSSPWFWGAGSFNWQNGNSWSTDFESNRVAYGNKDSWVDNVNLVFYEGHGNPEGFTFYPSAHDSGWFSYSYVDTRSLGKYGGGWGSKKLKWLGLLSCSVLADSHQNDWSYTMDGLHLLMGFATTAYDVSGFGSTFASRVLAGNSIKNAWLIACDQKQPSGVEAKVMGEEYYDMYESIYYQMPNHEQDATYWVQTKWCGTTQPPLYVNPQQVTAMPVFETPPLAFDAAMSKWSDLSNVFGVQTQTMTLAPTVQGCTYGTTCTAISGTHQLEMDSVSGMFYYIDSGALFSGTTTSQVGIMSTQDAKATADQFLNNSGLMPGDAQFAEVAPVNLDQLQKPGLASANAAEVVTSTLTDYEVIYSRIVTDTSTGLAPTQAISYSVVGAGSKLKVYVKPTGGAARVSSPGQAGAVVGAQGGWRQVASTSALAPQKMTAVLPYSQIETLFQKMEPQVAYEHVPFDNPTSKTILTSTLGYWEEATGVGQDQLYPAYILSAVYTGTSVTQTLVVTGVSYMPVDPTFMPPLAKIQSTSDLGKNLWPGQVITLSAANATKTLAQVGIDPSLDFVLGSGTGPYLYTWYRDSVAAGNEIPGTSNQKSITYTVTLSGTTWQGTPVPQTIYLVVKDVGSDHTSRNTAMDTVQVNVMPPVYLPLVIRGQ